MKDVLHRKAPNIPRVVDPVMAATAGGAALLPGSAAEALKRMLVAGAALVMPNLPEAPEYSKTLKGLRDSVPDSSPVRSRLIPA